MIDFYSVYSHNTLSIFVTAYNDYCDTIEKEILIFSVLFL